MKTDNDPGPSHAATPAEQTGLGWSPVDCLRSLGRAASIAAGAAPGDVGGFRIVTDQRDGAYGARITHYFGKAIRLPAALRHQLDAALFPSAEEAAQHARFLIASGALNLFRR